MPATPLLSNDPFLGTPVQTSRKVAQCRILVDGTDVTNNLDPHLINIRLLLGFAPMYNCEIELDDRDGRLPIPPVGAPVIVELGWKSESLVQSFEGTIIDVEHGFGRKQGGRRMWVRASGADWLKQIKSPMSNHWGEGAPPGKSEGDPIMLGQVLSDSALAAGASVLIHPSLASKSRDYWQQSSESFNHFINRIANEVGGVVKVEGGNKFTLTKPGEDPAGTVSASVFAVWGDNLIGWRVRPMVARSTWKASNQWYYDLQKSQWAKTAKDFGFSAPWSNAEGIFQLPAPAPNKGVADQQNEGTGDVATTFRGEGRIVINGEPRAQPNTYVIMQGARPGVDGAYLIITVEHTYSRQGFVTWLDVSPPQKL